MPHMQDTLAAELRLKASSASAGEPCPSADRAPAYADHFRGTSFDEVVNKGGVDVVIFRIQEEDIDEFPELRDAQEAHLWDGGIAFVMPSGKTIEFALS